MSWDETFATHYDRWSAHMTADVDFYVSDPVPHVIRYAAGDNRVDLILDDGGQSSLWWATKNEWLGLIDVAGLRLEALYGGFAREPFADDSSEYVFVARR